MTPRDQLLKRLDAVEARLAAQAATPAPPGALTEPDPSSGERWDAGQVWAHVAEFIPYWTQQVQAVIERFENDPIAFGRTKDDQGRIGAIERDRRVPVRVLWSGVLRDIDALRAFLQHADDRSWRARGVHPARGVMDVERILDEFLVGHLEEHEGQLTALARS